RVDRYRDRHDEFEKDVASVEGRCDGAFPEKDTAAAKRTVVLPILRRTRVIARGSAPIASFVGLGLYDFLAAVVAVRADVMAQVHLTAHGLNRERRAAQRIVGAMHAALRR